MKSIKLIIGLTFIVIRCAAQPFTIQGTVVDSTNRSPIAGVNILVEGTTTGTTTDKAGNFKLTIPKIPCVLKISHISYKTITVSIHKHETVSITIILGSKLQDLPEFSVWADKIRCINPDEPYFISDYRIMDGNILALGYKNRMFTKQYLILFTANGKKLGETEIKNNKGLYQDPDEYCYIAIEDSGYQVYFEEGAFYFSEAFDAALIDTARNTYAESREDTLLLKKYFCNNQVLSYYSWEHRSNQAREFKTYIYEDGINMMSWGPFFDGNEFDNRFAEQIFFKPVQAPVFVRENDVVVFNCIDGKIELYTGLSGNAVNETKMMFIQDKHWSGEIYYDMVKDRFYTSFIRKSTTYIAPVNIETGETGEETGLNGYSHIENIRIYNGDLFFLYKKYYGDDYKRLYVSTVSPK
jgi:hypothetical protein